VWDGWVVLDEGRTWGMQAPAPISIVEVQALCDLLGIASRNERLKYLRTIRRLDRIFLGHWAENNNNK
jgi:hypothetical protein